MDGIARQGGWNRLDVEMRERVGKEVEAVVGDAVRRFWTRCEGKGLEKCGFLCFCLIVRLLIGRSKVVLERGDEEDSGDTSVIEMQRLVSQVVEMSWSRSVVEPN
jgi:hypothetical protein